MICQQSLVCRDHMLTLVQRLSNKMLSHRCATDQFNQHLNTGVTRDLKDIPGILRTERIHLGLWCSRCDMSELYRTAHAVVQNLSALRQ